MFTPVIKYINNVINLFMRVNGLCQIIGVTGD